MNGTRRVFSLETDYGPVLEVGTARIVVESQVLAIRLPFAGFIWNRPIAIHVTQGGENRRIRVIDFTRVIQLALLVLISVLAILLRFQSGRRKELHE